MIVLTKIFWFLSKHSCKGKAIKISQAINSHPVVINYCITPEQICKSISMLHCVGNSDHTQRRNSLFSGTDCNWNNMRNRGPE